MGLMCRTYNGKSVYANKTLMQNYICIYIHGIQIEHVLLKTMLTCISIFLKYNFIMLGEYFIHVFGLV